jgi:hypothetical protein
MRFFDFFTNIFKKPIVSAEIIPETRIVYDSDRTGHLVPAVRFKADMDDTELKAFPIINEPMAANYDSGVFVHPFGIPPPVSYDILWTYFKYTPELQAVIRAIVEDIMSDGWFLEGGANKRKQAERFLMENFAKEQICSMIFDVIITGDGYLYAQKLSKYEVKSHVDSILEKPEIKSLIPDEMKAELGTTVMDSLDEDEDLFTPRSFVCIPSSTMKAVFNKNGDILQWIQKVGIRVQKYQPDEILHFRFLRLDGKFYGFSSLASVLKEMDILANVKDFARYYFEKGGAPNFMFTLPNEAPNSINVKNFKKTIQLYSSLANKWKSLVVAGEVDVKEIGARLSKDMEFRDLAKYLTQVIIMTWGVPVARLSDAGFGDKLTRGSAIAEAGYYRKISYMQDMLEDFINMFLLSKFKVTMRFNKTYLQDEVKEVQIDKIKTDTAEQRMNIGIWTREKAGEYLGLHPEDIPTDKEWQKLKDMLPGKQGWGSSPFGQSKLNKMQVLGEGVEKQAQATDKQDAALQNIKSSVKIKRLDDNTFEIVE